jgi:hypothetical protein
MAKVNNMQIIDSVFLEAVKKEIETKLATGNIVTRETIITALCPELNAEAAEAAKSVITLCLVSGFLPEYESKKRIGIRPKGEEKKTPAIKPANGVIEEE